MVRWVADGPQPGLVEAQLVDAEGRRWSFIDKASVFSADTILASSTFPVAAAIRCEIVDTEATPDDGIVVVITTERPDSVDSEGEMVFRVREELIR